jgi:hypothetical protein
VGGLLGEFVQAFILLAYLTIGLISITVPIYAISVSFLARETAKTSEIIKRRQEELQEKLEGFKLKLKESPETEDLKKEIKNYDERIEEIETNLSYLSARGAVGYPISFFLAALIFAILGIYSNPASENGVMVLTGLFIFFGLVCLGRALVGVERAALRIPSPEFHVEFESGATVEKLVVGEQKEILLTIGNIGEDLAETLRVIVFFPPDFDVIERENYNIFKQTGHAIYLNYNAVYYYYPLPCIYAGDLSVIRISLIAPRRTGKYEIPVHIDARNMRKSEHRLVIEVVGENRSG